MILGNSTQNNQTTADRRTNLLTDDIELFNNIDGGMFDRFLLLF